MYQSLHHSMNVRKNGLIYLEKKKLQIHSVKYMSNRSEPTSRKNGEHRIHIFKGTKWKSGVCEGFLKQLLQMSFNEKLNFS